MKKLLSGVLIFASIIVAALVVWTVVYNYRERLSDRQLIAIAVDDAIKSTHGSIKYSSADELMRLNPGCCIVRHSGHEWLSFPARLYEDGLSVVQMSYRIGGMSQAYYFKELQSMPMAKYWTPGELRKIPERVGEVLEMWR